MTNPDSERRQDGDLRGPTIGETTGDFVYLLLTVGTAVLAFSSVVLASEGLYAFAATDAVVTALLAYLRYRFGKNRRRGPVRNLNL